MGPQHLGWAARHLGLGGPVVGLWAFDSGRFPHAAARGQQPRPETSIAGTATQCYAGFRAQQSPARPKRLYSNALREDRVQAEDLDVDIYIYIYLNA